MMRLALFHEGFDLASLFGQFTESVTKEQRIGEFEDKITRRIRLTTGERSTALRPNAFKTRDDGQPEIPTEDMAKLAIERITGELTPEEQEKFLAIGW